MQFRMAETADAERLMDLINSAFRHAESFIIDRNRVDLEVVQSLMAKESSSSPKTRSRSPAASTWNAGANARTWACCLLIRTAEKQVSARCSCARPNGIVPRPDAASWTSESSICAGIITLSINAAVTSKQAPSRFPPTGNQAALPLREYVEAAGLTSHSTIASASISTRISGEISAATWTIDVAGRISRKNSPCAFPTFSHSEMLTT